MRALAGSGLDRRSPTLPTKLNWAINVRAISLRVLLTRFVFGSGAAWSELGSLVRPRLERGCAPHRVVRR